MALFNGFSKLRPDEKRRLLAAEGYLSAADLLLLESMIPSDPLMASAFEKMTENVISEFPLPYSIAPGFVINGREYAIPMVTEESSVVAAASWSARYWADRGGFSAEVISENKIGQIHFLWSGNPDGLTSAWHTLSDRLKSAAAALLTNMEARGGGINGMELINLTDRLNSLFQIRISFLTADAMGANFINSCLEAMAAELPAAIVEMEPHGPSAEVIMAILSNHTPDCRVKCTVECPADSLTNIRGAANPAEFARRFETAVRIAQIDPYRAVTHNKGIYNGIDAVILATGNDFRATEAAGHAFASLTGHYKSLTDISLNGGIFRYSLDIPMAVGTVGGLTTSHPVAAASLRILGSPGAADLMKIAASVGLATNFAAVKTLITTGIQAGHMPLHHRKETK
jgi:hydroxymethylglutaryl-CoA reductase